MDREFPGLPELPTTNDNVCSVKVILAELEGRAPVDMTPNAQALRTDLWWMPRGWRVQFTNQFEIALQVW